MAVPPAVAARVAESRRASILGRAPDVPAAPDPGDSRRTYCMLENEMLARISSLLLMGLCLSLTAPARADEPRPLKVLWCTGGGFHDFKGLTPLLNDSIRKYANARFDVTDD